MSRRFIFLIAMSLLAGLPSVRAQSGTLSFSSATFSTSEAAGNVVITVLRTGGTNGSVGVSFATSDGTAQAGSDYSSANGTLTFADGQASTSFTVNVVNDSVIESNETVNLTLSNPTGGAALGVPSTAVLTIIDNDTPVIQFAATNFDVDEGAGSVDITVVRTGGTNSAASVDFATSDGSATAGMDYTSITGTVSFAVGETSTTFSVAILEDSVTESNETVNLTLSNPTGASLGGDKTATVTILDNEPPSVQFGAATFRQAEGAGSATVTVTRFGSTADSLTVDFETSDGTATSGQDYLATSGTLNFAPGDSSKTFSITLLDDHVFENNETVNVTLSNPNGAMLGELSEAVLTILNDDPQIVNFPDEDGDLVSVSLTGHGTMQIELAGDGTGPIDSITLAGTDQSSTLRIRVKQVPTGDGLVSIGAITGDGALQVLDAKACDIDSLILDGNFPLSGMTIALHEMDGGTLSLSNSVKKLTAAAIIGGTEITAPRIGTFNIKGDKSRSIPGDLDADISLTGDLDPGSTLTNTIGTLFVAGAITNTTISIEDGNLRVLRATAIVDSVIAVGYEPDSEDAFASGTFMPDLQIGSVSVRGTDMSFRNSSLIASRVGVVRLRSVQTDNDGVAFGVFAPQSIEAVSVRTPKFSWRPKGADDQSLNDFHVKQ